MNRINRVTSILIQLQSKKIIPAKEIAQRFNISLRTVYRDIRTLEEAGIPIGSEAGKGYFLVEGFLLPAGNVYSGGSGCIDYSREIFKLPWR